MCAQFWNLSLAKIKHVLAVIKTLDFAPEVYEACEKWLEMDPLEICHLTSSKGLHFATIVHGDSWMNNIMYKYNDKNELEDVQLVGDLTYYLIYT